MSDASTEQMIEGGQEGTEEVLEQSSATEEHEGGESGHKPEGEPAKHEKIPPGYVPAGRLAEVARERREARRELAEMRAEIEQLRAAPRTQQERPYESEAPKRPRPEDFGTREAWDAAMDRYDADKAKDHETAAERRIREQMESERGKSGEQAQIEQARNRVIETFDSRFAELAKENKAVTDALPVFAQMQGDNPAIWWGVVQHPEGAKIAVEMANDLAFADDVLSSSPLRAGQIIAERLAELKSRAPKTTPGTTTTVGGSGKSHATLSDSMSEEEWYKARRAQGE
jgi:hypothetical protein